MSAREFLQSLQNYLLIYIAQIALWEARWPHGSSGPGSGPCWGHCVVFLGKTL